MKKALLLTAMAAFSATSFAQLATFGPDSEATMPEGTGVIDREATEVKAPATRPHKVLGDAWNLYYSRPKGTLYRGASPTGGTYIQDNIIVPPLSEFKLTNHAKEPANTKWTNYSFAADYTQYADEDGSYSVQAPSYNGYRYYMYVLTQDVKSSTGADSTASFYLGQSVDYYSDPNYSQYHTASYFPGFKADSLNTNDDNDHLVLNSGWKRFFSGMGSNYYWGSFDNRYLFGAATYTDKDNVVWQPDYIIQRYPKPAAPLYVKDITALVASYTQPLKNNAQLRMILQKYDEETGYGDVIANLVATVEDVDSVYHGTYGGNAYNRYQVHFYNNVVDEFNETIVEPFVINDEFAVIIPGLNTEDYDFTIATTGIDPDDVDNVAYGTIEYLKTADDTRNIWYGMDMALNLQFNSTFDYVEPWTSVNWTLSSGGTYTQENANVLKVSDDGRTTTTYDTYLQQAGINYVLVQTGFRWKDADGVDLYYCEDLPEWVIDIQADETDREAAQYKDDPIKLTFVTEPLPAGVSGRYAVIHLQGYGYKAESPIILLQGDATLEQAAIHEAKALTAAPVNAHSYNLAGQQVGNDFRGIAIENGKKVIKK